MVSKLRKLRSYSWCGKLVPELGLLLLILHIISKMTNMVEYGKKTKNYKNSISLLLLSAHLVFSSFFFRSSEIRYYLTCNPYKLLFKRCDDIFLMKKFYDHWFIYGSHWHQLTMIALYDTWNRNELVKIKAISDNLDSVQII